MLSDNEFCFARLAVDKAKLSFVSSPSKNPSPRVGVVVANGSTLIGWAAKGIGGEVVADGALRAFNASPAQHAEEALLARIDPDATRGSTVYVTLEPCTARKKGTSCADLLVTAGIAEIFIGNSDPNPDVGSLAWRIFHRNQVTVRDFPPDLRNEARRDNAAFFAKFAWSTKENGSGAFNYEENGGLRVLGEAGKEFETRWTSRGPGLIYALDYAHDVAIAKHCSDFLQVDDPGRWFEDKHYTKPVDEGEIVIFRNAYGYALVKVFRVSVRGEGANAELQFAYELRLF